MNLARLFFALIAVLTLSLTACAANQPPADGREPINASAPSQEQAVEIAWQALAPNTSSQDRAAWALVEAKIVTGSEVEGLFEGEPVPGNCAPGPAPDSNAKITPTRSYWYVLMQPIRATPKPVLTEQYSPTAPPNIPEPFLYQAYFLIDAGSGEVIARKLLCVIY